MTETQRKRIIRNGIKLYAANGKTNIVIVGIRGGGVTLRTPADITTTANAICQALDSLQGQRSTRRQKAEAIRETVENIA